MKPNCYPLTFLPVYQDYPWGGSRIPQTFNRKLPSGIYAESWEISDRDDGMSIVANGPFAGSPFSEVLQEAPQTILGTKVPGNRFPLLIKLIDAKQKLSVQVHPNDETSAKFGGEAKTEMWYLLGDNAAQIYCGLKDGIDRKRFEQSIADGTCSETLRTVAVKKDDAVFVRGGCVHAIDEGCLILEIQQNSNTTYRVYDWDRMGNDGKPRELHIEQALNVINWNNDENPLTTPELLSETQACQIWKVLECEYFRLDKLLLSGPAETALDGTTFHALFVAEGEAEICWGSDRMIAVKGTSVLIPAALPTYTLNGQAVILRTSIS